MALVSQPAILPGAFAAEGDKFVIPANNDGLAGLASIAKGFPPITQQPLDQGGLPPQREDFNGIFNLFSLFLLYIQNGGVFAYNNGLDYQPPCLVADPDSNIIYQCLQQNGPNTSAGVQALTQDAYWQPIVATGYIGSDEINAADGVAGLDSSVKLLSQLYDFATQEEAEAGTNNTKPMNALRVAQAIAALAGEAVIVDNLLQANGYIKFSNGFTVQWQKVNGAALGTADFPISYENECLAGVVCLTDLANSTGNTTFVPISASQFQYRAETQGGGTAAGAFAISIGH